MPEYEYRCKKCEQIFAVERSMNDSSSVNCAHCNSTDLARIWGVNFVTANAKAGNNKSAAQGEACASNPAKPKSCCPCG